MAITIKNLHKDLPEDQLHEAKGFTTASNNSYLKKNNDGESEWSQSIHLSKSALSQDPTPLEMLKLEVTDDGVDMAAGHGPAITFYVGETGGSDWGGTIGVVREIESDADSASAMVFHTAIDDTYPAERMRISSVGDVTITGGLTLGTDLSVANGGTGASTLTANGVLIGNGTSAIASVDMSTKGHILIGDGSGNPQMLAIGDDDQVLTADSGETTGVKWAAAGGGGGATDLDGLTDGEIGNGSGAGYNIFLSNGATAGGATQHGTISAGTLGNIAIGGNALQALSSGDYNLAMGERAGYAVTTSESNICIGYYAGSTLSTTSGNVFIGRQAGSAGTGTKGVAIGYQAMGAGAGADTNSIVIGEQAGYNITSGGYNLVLGRQAGYNISTGARNVLLGAYNTGHGVSTASYNVIIGDTANAANANNQVAIGYGAVTDAINKIRIGNASMATANIQIDWTIDSDERIKENVTDGAIGLDFINDLRPVTFTKKHPADWDSAIIEDRYKSGGSNYDDENDEVNKDDFDSTSVIDGLIAQEVKETIDSLGVNFSGWSEDSKGKQGIQYAALVVPLIKAVQELSAKVDALENA